MTPVAARTTVWPGRIPHMNRVLFAVSATNADTLAGWGRMANDRNKKERGRLSSPPQVLVVPVPELYCILQSLTKLIPLAFRFPILRGVPAPSWLGGHSWPAVLRSWSCPDHVLWCVLMPFLAAHRPDVLVCVLHLNDKPESMAGKPSKTPLPKYSRQRP